MEAVHGAPVAVSLDPHRLQPEALAQMFHEAYERLAPSFGYQTNWQTARPWPDVPEQNRRLMIAVATELLARLRGEATVRVEE